MQVCPDRPMCPAVDSNQTPCRYEEVIGCERSSAVGSTCCTRRPC